MAVHILVKENISLAGLLFSFLSFPERWNEIQF